MQDCTNINTSHKITYRQYRKEDIPKIIDLWEENSGFGSLTNSDFETWFLNMPYEQAEIIIGENDNQQIIAQMVFMPCRATVDGKEVKAMRISSPIISKEHRFADLADHPVLKMFVQGMMVAATKGFSLLYLFPARGWLRAINAYSHIIKWNSATFNTSCISLDRAVVSHPKHQPFVYTQVSTFNAEYDKLWEDAVKDFPIRCGISRKKEWLQYRLGDHCVIETRDKNSNALVGYIAVKKKTGLLVDLLAASKIDLKKMFWGAMDALALVQKETGQIVPGKVTAMQDPLIRYLLEARETEEVDFKFEFACCCLDRSIEQASIEVENWYLTPDV